MVINVKKVSENNDEKLFHKHIIYTSFLVELSILLLLLFIAMMVTFLFFLPT